MNRLQNRTAIVTGAASGMGRSHAITLAGEGARVVVTDRDTAGGRETVAQIERSKGSALFVEHDISDELQWNTVFEQCIARFGDPDILVNNAGVYIAKPTDQVSVAEWDFVMNVNARGTFLGCRAAIPAMKRRGGGSIINISSSFGIVGRADFAAYCASKGAVRLLTKSLAAELAPFKIRVNSVHPGVIETAMTQPLLADPNGLEFLLGGQPLRRAAQPSEVSAGVLFLASDDASYVTGSELVIDGGYVSV